MTTRAAYLEKYFGHAWRETLFGAAVSLPPCFHPTRCCLIDDNQSHLDSLRLELDGFWPHLTFTQVELALERLHATKQPTLAERCLGTYRDEQGVTATMLNLQAIEETLANPERFAQTSILLVDYAMPQLSGLDFCKLIHLPGAQRVLLTGGADDAAAVSAFNAGLIEHCVKKHQFSSARPIAELVASMERLYFDAQAASLNTRLTAPFLTDATVTRYVYKQLQQLRIVEFYLVTQPTGLLLLDAFGRRWRIIIVDTPELERQQRLLARHAAPAKVQQALSDGSAMLYLWDQPEEYGPQESFPWQERLYETHYLEGTRSWYLALVEDPPTDIDFDPEEGSFYVYLNRFEPASRRAAC